MELSIVAKNSRQSSLAPPICINWSHASVLVKAPADFNQLVLEVHKNVMAAA